MKGLLGEKIDLEVTFWKELLIGVLKAIFAFTIIFLLVFNLNEEVISVLQQLNEDVSDVFSLYVVCLPIVAVIGIIVEFAIFSFTALFRKPVKKATATRKPAAKKTTVKKTTKKAK